jgi:phosphate transport system substrate-binding protein
MKVKGRLKIIFVALALGAWLWLTVSNVTAQEVLRYSCSNQVYAAFSMECIKSFTKATGIKVDVKAASSDSCIYSLGSGFSDIASTARKLHRGHMLYGYREFPFCKDPIAVITRKECGVDSLTESQIQDIFAGEIANWKELGGADLPVTVIVPDKNTAAHKNFRRHVMKTKEIEHDFMAYYSTMVLEAVRYFPCGSVSFISQGATVNYPEIKTIRVSGLLPTDKNYPYHQIFYYVTKGDPTGDVKKFIDYTYSEEGAKIIRAHGMIPLAR